MLKQVTLTPWPEDVTLEISINGEIVNTWDKAHLEKTISESKFGTEKIAKEGSYVTFLDDEEIVTKYGRTSYLFGLRIQSKIDPKNAGLSISHLYFA